MIDKIRDAHAKAGGDKDEAYVAMRRIILENEDDDDDETVEDATRLASYLLDMPGEE